MPNDGIKKTTVTVRGKLKLSESLICGKDKNDNEIEYDLYELLEEFDGECISFSISKEKIIAPLGALRGVRKDDIQDAPVPAQPKEAEPVFASGETVSDIH